MGKEANAAAPFGLPPPPPPPFVYRQHHTHAMLYQVATVLFVAASFVLFFHRRRSRRLLLRHAAPDTTTPIPPKTPGPAPVISPTTPTSFPLIHKTAVSDSVAVYRFALPRPTDTLGLAVGQHISLLATIHGKLVRRPYTPVTLDIDATNATAAEKNGTGDDAERGIAHDPLAIATITNTRGYFDLLVKSYPTGNISKLLASLPLGSSISVLGPSPVTSLPSAPAAPGTSPEAAAAASTTTPDIAATSGPAGAGAPAPTYPPLSCRHLNMVAGGTGITPMFQILLHMHRARALLGPLHPMPAVSLVYANDSDKDVLLRPQLDALAAAAHDTDSPISIYYALPSEAGYRDLLLKHTARPDPKDPAAVKMLICGAPPLVSAIKKAAVDIGYAKPRPVSKPDDAVFVF